MSSSTILALLHLGEIEHDTPWSDYLKLGLSPQDIPALLNLLSDPALHAAPVDSKEIWAPQHAWRALGQLGDARALKGIIASLNTLVNDDAAHQELPTVLCMIGVSAQPLLGEFLSDSNNQEFARAIAAQALQDIALKYPSSRTLSVELLTKHCAALEQQYPDLNALVVCNLLDLQAVESIQQIRELYSREIVDLYAVGDIEDVEMALGLREQRDTPRPDYGKVHSLNPQSNAVDIFSPTDSLEDELEQFLKQYGDDHSLPNKFALDGFIAAIICAPATIIPSRWINAIWGGEQHQPNFPDEKTAHLFTSAILTFYNQLVRALRDGAFNALFGEYQMSDKKILIVDDWCYGFMQGFALWQPINSGDRIIVEQHLHPIKLFASEQGDEQLEKMDEQQLTAEKLKIESSVRALFDHFVTQQGPNQPQVDDTPKVGRNDPCPCGSGKKFKKCCLH